MSFIDRMKREVRGFAYEYTWTVDEQPDLPDSEADQLAGQSLHDFRHGIGSHPQENWDRLTREARGS